MYDECKDKLFCWKVSIIIDNYKLYVGKSNDYADKWIVMQ